MDFPKTVTNVLNSREDLLREARATIDRLKADYEQFRKMPTLSINLMLKRTVDNDQFYKKITIEWFEEARRRHPKFKVIRELEWGVAVAILPRTFDDYFMYIEASARRNYKKAKRNGYTFSKLDINKYLDDVREIRQSTDVRQGKVPEDLMYGEIERNTNPPSRNHYHDYPYVGVFKDGKLVAYASAFVGGEVCSLEHILGHADYQSDGIVPMMIIGLAEVLYKEHPAVRYFMYGTYFGAGKTLRRYKKKFRFYPHHVYWMLDARETSP